MSQSRQLAAAAGADGRSGSAKSKPETAGKANLIRYLKGRAG